jgi:aldehyde:ferredoxin oxidoreductase
MPLRGEAAERATMMARAFNSREGFTIKDDTLPRRLFDPKPDGPDSGKRIFEQEDFEKALESLYQIMGCDPETGRPHRGKLMELGLEWVNELLDKEVKGR